MKYDIYDFTCYCPAVTSSPLKPPFLLAPTVMPPARPLEPTGVRGRKIHLQG